MRLKRCGRCGDLFCATREDQKMCEKCLAEAKSTTIRRRICRECGSVFSGGPRAWYCPICRKARSKEAAGRYRKSGASRPLGSSDRCTICGKEYTVNGSRQRYCPGCAPEAVRAIDRAASRQWNAENDFYAKRQPRRGQKVCVICGNPVPSGTPRITCSDECDALRRRLQNAVADVKRGKRKSLPDIKRLDKG